MKSFESIIQEIESKQDNLIRKIVFFVCPLTNDYDYRVAYFTEPAEAELWEIEMKHYYNYLGFKFTIKTDTITMKKEN